MIINKKNNNKNKNDIYKNILKVKQENGNGNEQGQMSMSIKNTPSIIMGEKMPLQVDLSANETPIQIHLKNKNLTNLNLSCACKEIILGTLLGDGSLKLQKAYKNPRLCMRHSILQKDYLEWKVSHLKEISSSKSILTVPADGFSKFEKISYQSRALEELMEIYKITYKKNKLEIKRKWLNHLTPKSLLVWWLDDGSIISNGRSGVFCTDGFSKDQNIILSKYLNKVWGIDNRVAPASKKNLEICRIWLSPENLKKFLRIILSQLETPSMLHKFILLYKHPQLQQRWISELKENLPQYQKEIDEAYLVKKKKWKNFSSEGA